MKQWNPGIFDTDFTTNRSKAMKNQNHKIEFEFKGVKGMISGINCDHVQWSGMGFQIDAAQNGIKEVITEAIEDYFEAISWNECCEAMNKAEARWVDNGCSSIDPGYTDNGERPGFNW